MSLIKQSILHSNPPSTTGIGCCLIKAKYMEVLMGKNPIKINQNKSQEISGDRKMVLFVILNTRVGSIT